jgi:hypothetical protein
VLEGTFYIFAPASILLDGVFFVHRGICSEGAQGFIHSFSNGPKWPEAKVLAYIYGGGKCQGVSVNGFTWSRLIFNGAIIWLLAMLLVSREVLRLLLREGGCCLGQSPKPL